ncbi:hypothetical protein DPX16_20667 [Anabarilius grahami]|uniref:Uncharacterized protein n=1 Tax=Anabarilius grahami TaxID=495550 RepID=A0A3N0YL76_ANAGA|nr:hypothetical protein DPX16_20667 [Anabarilius grahami]
MDECKQQPSRCYHVGVGFYGARGSSVVSDWLPQVFRLLTDLHDLCSQSDLDMERFVTSALLMNDKNKKANQNPSCFKELEHLKRQMTKLQHALGINRTISSAGVDANIVIILSVNGPFDFSDYYFRLYRIKLRVKLDILKKM